MKKVSTLTAAMAFVIALTSSPFLSLAQDESSFYKRALNAPDKLFNLVEKKRTSFERKVQASTRKYLRSLTKNEKRIKKKLRKSNPLLARELFEGDNQFDSILNNLKQPSTSTNYYSGYIDSLKTGIQFLQQYQSPELQTNMQGISNQYSAMQSSVDKINIVQAELKKRQDFLQERLKSTGQIQLLNSYKEKIYYYRSQIDQYKRVLQEPRKLESALLSAVRRVPEFQKFFNKHSQLASIFRLPGGEGQSVAAIPGLQTRQMVMTDLDGRLGIGSNVNQYMASSIKSAQSGLAKAKEKLAKFGENGSDMDMPNFKPNKEKTKSFLQRIEVGTNIQSTKSNAFFPVTTDFGLSLGYKFSPKIIAGLGTSYKLGWGKSIRHISLTHQGVGFRTFFDAKFKGSIWVSGGGEMNYRSEFKDISQLHYVRAWQKSALAGISKRYVISKKMSGSIQVYYDFLYRYNVPVTQPIIFRSGYNF